MHCCPSKRRHARQKLLHETTKEKKIFKCKQNLSQRQLVKFDVVVWWYKSTWDNWKNITVVVNDPNKCVQIERDVLDWLFDRRFEYLHSAQVKKEQKKHRSQHREINLSTSSVRAPTLSHLFTVGPLMMPFSSPRNLCRLKLSQCGRDTELLKRELWTNIRNQLLPAERKKLPNKKMAFEHFKQRI